MDINEIINDDSQFSLESILKEFGGGTTPEPKEESDLEPQVEISHPLELNQDDGDIHIYSGRIDEPLPEAEAAQEYDCGLDEVDRIIAEIRGEEISESEAKSDDEPVIMPAAEEAAPEEETDSDEKPEIPQQRKRVNVFAMHGKFSDDDEPVISPDAEPQEIEIPDSGEYADGSTDYSELTEEYVSDSELVKEEKRKPRTFKDAVGTSVLTALALIGVHLGQSKSFFTAAPPEEEADLGEELSCGKAAKFYEKRSESLRARSKLSVIVTAVLMYISFGFPVIGALNYQAVAAAVCLILLLTVMILGLDIITSGLAAIGKKRLNANTLVALSCVFSVIDGFVTACGVKTSGIPFCAVSALTLCLTLLGGSMNCRANNLVFRIAASSRRMYTLSAECDVFDGSITLLKSNRGTDGFVRRTEEAGPDELVFGAMAPVIIPAALLLGIIATAISGSWSNISHVVSGIFVFAAPASYMLFFALPFFVSTLGLAPHGSCIAGWSGLYDMGKCKDIIITDRDLFSSEDVSVKELRILAGADPKEVISMAGSIMAASGCAMSHAFDELMDKANGSLLEVDGFKCHESGGLVALINGKEVICGSSGFMQLMNVRLVDKVMSKNCVYLAVNRVLSGIFEMSYNADKDVRTALQKLLASNRHPIFAIRDFNLTPTMLSRKFDTPTDGFDFPTFPKRYAVSSANPSENSKPAAVLSKEGLEPYVDLSDHGKRLYNLVSISGILAVLSSVIGMLLMFIFFACSVSGATSVSTVLIYMLLWLLPVVILSLTFKTE